MAEDSVNSISETTTVGWGGRLSNSVMGFFVGLIFLVAGPGLLWWNEGNEVKSLKALAEAQTSVLAISADTVIPNNEGHLVYTSAPSTIGAPPYDPLFVFNAPDQLRLRRNVEMFQWKETKDQSTVNQVGGSQTTTTNYSYSQTWSQKYIPSSSFHLRQGHENPPMPLSTETFNAKNIKVGVFTLSTEMVSKLSDFQQYVPSLASLPEGFKSGLSGLYYGQDEHAPQVGDLRITFHSIPVQQLSVVAGQQSDALVVHNSTSGFAVGLIKTGIYSANYLIKAEIYRQVVLAWVLRAVGFFLIFLAILLLLRPLTLLGAFIPFLGDLLGAASGLIALAVALTLGTVTIGISWFAFRPVLGIGIVAFGLLLAVGFSSLKRNTPTK